MNAVKIPDRYPIPNLRDFSHNLHGKKIFTTIDLNRAYHQLPIHPNDVEKTAVITPFGLQDYLFYEFGLMNGAQSCQRCVNRALAGIDFAFAFIDDIIIASEDEIQHQEHVEIVLSRLDQFHLCVNINKCVFAEPEVTFLDHIVNADGIRPTAKKVKAVVDYPNPHIIDELRRFLGMVNFYRPFLSHAAETQLSLNAYLHNARKEDKRPVQWTAES